MRSADRTAPTNVIILAAGYPTRHAPHALGTPSPLLPIAGRPLIVHTLERLSAIPNLGRIVLLTNNTYLGRFTTMLASADLPPHVHSRIHIASNRVDDLRKLVGPIGDLAKTLREPEHEDMQSAPLLVVGGDNFLDFDLSGMSDAYFERSHDVFGVFGLTDLSTRPELLSRFGVVKLRRGFITDFQEKPPNPKPWKLASALCWLLSPGAIAEVLEYASTPSRPYRVGPFVRTMLKKGKRIYGHQITGAWYDVEYEDQYREASLTAFLKLNNSTVNLRHSLEAVILFADVISASSISEYSSEEVYGIFLDDFQRICQSVLEETLEQYTKAERSNFIETRIQGDELAIIMYTPKVSRDVWNLVRLAVELKRRCFLSTFNKERAGRMPYDIGIGIHLGRVELGNHPSAIASNRPFNAEGYAINVAKRIEGYSRRGKFSRIMISKRAADLLPRNIKVGDQEDVELRGLHGSAPIQELKIFGDVNDPESAPPIRADEAEYYVRALESGRHDMTLLMMVARYFYDLEDFQSAERYYERAVASYPEFSEGHMYLGRTLYRMQNYDKAVQILRESCRLQSNSVRAWHFLAVSLRRMLDYDAALESHMRAVRSVEDSLSSDGMHDPKNGHLKELAGWTYNAYAYTLAETALSRSQDLGREEITELVRKARAYSERSVALLGENVNRQAYIISHTEAMIEMASGQFRDAESKFKLVIHQLEDQFTATSRKREEKLLEARYHLGDLLCSMGFKKSGEEHLRRSLQVERREDGSIPDYYWLQAVRRQLGIS